ncbi:MAG: glycosyltransferase family 2 protein [Verrucomicrobiota bacterium]
MPVRNEAKFIEPCLAAILAQEYPEDKLELIVVDGMSDDGTRAIIEKIAMNDRRIMTIENPRRIAPCAMNLGIGVARGDIIFRVDGHAIIPADYVKECVLWLSKEQVDGVGGAMDYEMTSYVESAIAACMASSFGIGGSRFRTTGQKCPHMVVDTLPFWAFRRAVFDRVGLFNEHMVRHQDYELNYRIRCSGGKLILLPWLRVRYYVRSTLFKFWSQYWQYGVWKGRFLRMYPASVRARHFVPPLFALALLATLLLVLFSPASGWLCLAWLAGFYALFLGIATITLAARGYVRQAPLIPLILLSLHLLWGTGVWVGILSGKIGKEGKPCVAN